MLRAALVAARNNVSIAPTTLQNLAKNCPPIPTPWPPAALAVFGDLLATGPGLVSVWEGLDLAGVVEKWIPEWAAVRSRPQRNAVHRHTVDRHLIETVVRASGLLREVNRPDLLLLAALLHDIGKVPGSRDHSETGAPIADRVLQRLGVGDEDRALVVQLVREHLTLIDLATRRDGDDPQTIAMVSRAVGGSLDNLDLLRALTEADASAAGPAAWTDWRASLLDKLVTTARAALAEGASAPDSFREADPVSADVLSRIAVGQPVVVITPLGGAHRVDVYDRDRLGLFADTAGLLAAQGHIVRSAVVRTVDGIASNEWHVETPGGGAPEEGPLVRGLTRLAGGGPRATGHAVAPPPRHGVGLVAGHLRFAGTDPGDGDLARVRLRRRSSRSGPPTGPGCSTTSASPCREPRYSVRTRTSRRMPARRWTPSTSPSSADAHCRPRGSPRRSR